jgi:energy-coupling factor transporter ATP-binding protein EcfA2
MGGEMSDFSDHFCAVFPEHANDKWIEALQPEDRFEQAHLVFNHLPSVALLQTTSTAISLAWSTLNDLDATYLGEGFAAINGLVAVADAVIGSDAEARTRSRELVDLLLKIAYFKPARLPLVRAHAAVIHARANDRMLASWRLNEYFAEPPPSEDGPGQWNDIARQDSLVAYAQRLLGLEREPAPELEITPDHEIASDLPIQQVNTLIWNWLMGLGTDPAIGQLEQLISQSALQNPDETFGLLINALKLVPRVIGFSAGLADRGAPLLMQAEELMWLTGSSRNLLSSQLALAAASLNDTALAQRCASDAFQAISRTLSVLSHEQLLDLAANLLLAQALVLSGPAVAEPQTDAFRATTGTAKLIDNSGSPVVDEPLPDTLGETLTSGNVLLVAGPEIPVIRGAPGTIELLRSLVERTDDPSLNEAARQHVLAGMAQGDLDPAARLLRARKDRLETGVAEMYAGPRLDSGYDALAQISFTGVVNMSWDSWLLDAFAHRSPVVIHADSGEALTAAKSQEFAFTWFAGDPNREQIAISPREVRARLYADDTLSRFLTGIVQSSSLLFVGVRAADIIDFFEALPASSGIAMSPTMPTAQRRFAVCAIDELWELNRSQLRSSFGVELIGYNPADNGGLARIVERLSYIARPTGSQTSLPTQQPMLSRITLTNIGAFEQLDLELGEAWNLLLGNNGCGKSTVLRAVALGLCGDHPSAIEAGEALLRTGCDKGLIELQVGASRFRTELQHTSGTVRVRTSSLTPLQQGNWAVLGFPALRGISLTTPTGISFPQVPEPRVEDLLPLLRNEVDDRLDDIKQWIINVEARTHQPGGERSRQLLDQFFNVLGELTPDVTLKFEGVDPASWEVWVRTDDGVVSIDQLSQGMSSIIAWVGTLLQRMYDIYEDRDDPTAETAFVLIDELDAHLHPAWQRLLPSLTRQHFPQVQFLATSHSPLIASSLRSGELFVAIREPRPNVDGTEQLVATITAAEVDPQGLRADQILTSPLFGLMTSRSPEFGNQVDRYSQLMTSGSLTPEEQAEVRRLKSAIAASYRDGETAVEREAEAKQDAELEQALADVELTEQNIAGLRKLADSLGATDEEGGK